jgi:hypothetical protein
MAKQYGSLVGTLLRATPPSVSPAGLANSPDIIIMRDKCEVAASATDQVQLAKVPWETVVDPFGSDFSFDDLGTGTTLSVGDVTYPNALCNAQDVATAAGTAKICKSVDINNYYKPLWEMLGYATLAAAKLIGAQCELIFTVNTAAGAGTLTWQLKGHKL